MSNEIKDFFKTYSDFVTKVTSDPSLDLDALMERLKEIDASSDIKSARLLTAAMGLGSCLLYTSPSPRDQRGSRMPSSA